MDTVTPEQKAEAERIAALTPEEKEAVRQANIKRLAAGLVAYDKQKKAKSASEFA